MTQETFLLFIYMWWLFYFGKNQRMAVNFKRTLMKEHAMIDLGTMKDFLGIQVKKAKEEFFIEK